MIYFLSDTHFFHEKIISVAKRPFSSLEEMHETIIYNYLNVVTPQDDVYFLGDFAFRYDSVDEVNNILKRLPGKKYLITGNHDLDLLKEPNFDKSSFVWIKGYYELRYKKRKFVLFHYPIADWNGRFRGSIHIYGHIHNQILPYGGDKRSINVSVESIGYKPISIETILEKCDSQPIVNFDVM